MIQFYHLLSTPLERALPKLMQKTLSAGMRAVVLADSESTLQRLDDALWAAEPSSFIPHGLASGEEPERQPILLSLREETPNGAKLLAITDGSTPGDVGKYDRILDVFDGHDPEAVQAARSRWKTYKDAGHVLQYIQQQKDGAWQQKMTSEAA